jgi:hypothetical protein
MLQPKNLLTKRGPLLSKEPRVDRKVFATIGFPDFAFGISVIFSDCCPATVSDSETVFLCPLSSSHAAWYYLWTPTASPTTVAAAASDLAHIGSPFLRHG